MLVTDYDDTLTNDINNLNELKRELDDFKSKGNIFVIATGRAFSSITERIKKEFDNIEYDYLLTNHGAVIMDKNNNILKSYNIQNNTLKKILKVIDQNKIYKKHLFLETKEINYEKNKYNKIMLEYKNLNDALIDYKKIKQLNKCECYLINRKNQTPKLEIINKKINKSKSIKYLKENLNIKEIYVIGDAEQDYKMIKEFKGFAVENASKRIKKISEKQYKYVTDLIKEINRS